MSGRHYSVCVARNFLLAVFLSTSFSYSAVPALADTPPADRWWQVERPTQEDCAAAREIDKQSAAWGLICAGQSNSAPPPSPEQQQLALEAEKTCSGTMIESAKDHDAFEECLTNFKVARTLATNEAIRALCSGRTGFGLAWCIDTAQAYGGSASKFRRIIREHLRLQEWADAVEQEWLARRKEGGNPDSAGRCSRTDTWQVNGKLYGCPCGYGLKPTPGAFGGWSCQELGLFIPDGTFIPPDSPGDQGSNMANPGGSSGPAAAAGAGPTIRFAVPGTSAPTVSAPAARRTDTPRVSPGGAPRTDTPTVSATPPRSNVPSGMNPNTQSTITGAENGRTQSNNVGGVALDVTFENRGQDILGYDSQQGTIVGSDGRKVDIKPLITALQKVATAAAKNPFIPSSSSGTLRFSPDVQRALTQRGDELRNVGGIELDVTFQNLALLGVPDMRVTGPATLIENPIMLSLKRLVAAAKPYSDSPEHWEALPEHIRYPGSLGRVHGYVLDPSTQDVFIIGTEAKMRQARLDIDLLTVLMDTVWSKGLIPAVSLDPTRSPAGTADGPQRVRVIDLPGDALVSRILVDADYAMKRIDFGATTIPNIKFKSLIDILKTEPRDDFSSRAWFHPIPLNSNSVRISGSGSVVLHDVGVQVLSERMTDPFAGIGTGETNPADARAAEEFTAAFPRLETSDAVKPVGVFSLLHGITDIVTLCKLLQDAEIHYSVLDDIRQLPYRHLSGAEALPATYPGLKVNYRTREGRNRALSGGVMLRSRPTRRALDRFDDEVVVSLQRVAGAFKSDGFAQRLTLSFTLASPHAGNSPAAELAKVAGKRLLATNQPAEATKRFRDAVTNDPLDIDGWIYLGLSEAQAGNHPQARNAIEHARAIDANDSMMRMAAAQIAFLADPGLDLNSVDPTVRRDLSNEYAERAIHGKTYAELMTSYRVPGPVADRGRTAVESANLAVRWAPDNPQAYVARAAIHEALDDPDAALQDYEQAIRLSPTATLGPMAAVVFSKRGDLFYRKDQYALAIEDYGKSIRLDPSNPKVFYARGNALRRYRSEPWKDPDYKRAVADYGEAIRLDPNYARALEEHADISNRLREYDQAIQDHTRLIVLDPEDEKHHAFWHRGFAYKMKGDFDRAIADYTEAIRRDPKDALYLRSRAEAYRKIGEFDRAIADYTEAIRIEPKPALYFRAELWRELGQFEKAIVDYTEMIRLDPKNVDGYQYRARVWAEIGDIDRAMADFSEAIRVAAKPARGYRARAFFWSKRGELDRAIADLTEAIRLGQDKDDYRDRAKLFQQMGDLERATADFTEAIRVDPRPGWSYIARADFWTASGRFERAIADCSEAIRLEPNKSHFYFERAEVWRKWGDLDRALSDYNEAIRLDPESVQALEGRGTVYETKGDVDSAIGDFTEALRAAKLRWNGSSAEALKRRGNAYRKKGETELAERDIRQAAQLHFEKGRQYYAKSEFKLAAGRFRDSTELNMTGYSVLWLYLAQARMGDENAAELAAYAARLTKGGWPYPVIELYLGQRSINGMQSTFTSSADRCEAEFFKGQWLLLRGNRRDAQAALKAAATTCPKTSDTYRDAIAETGRLKL